MNQNRRFQFGLASLFALITIVAVIMAIPSAQEKPEHERRAEATRALQQQFRQVR